MQGHAEARELQRQTRGRMHWGRLLLVNRGGGGAHGRGQLGSWPGPGHAIQATCEARVCVKQEKLPVATGGRKRYRMHARGARIRKGLGAFKKGARFGSGGSCAQHMIQWRRHRRTHTRARRNRTHHGTTEGRGVEEQELGARKRCSTGMMLAFLVIRKEVARVLMSWARPQAQEAACGAPLAAHTPPAASGGRAPQPPNFHLPLRARRMDCCCGSCRVPPTGCASSPPSPPPSPPAGEPYSAS